MNIHAEELLIYNYKIKCNYTVANEDWIEENKILFSETLKNYYKQLQNNITTKDILEMNNALESLVIEFNINNGYMYFKYWLDEKKHKRRMYKIKIDDYIVWWRKDFRSYEVVNKKLFEYKYLNR